MQQQLGWSADEVKMYFSSIYSFYSSGYSELKKLKTDRKKDKLNFFGIVWNCLVRTKISQNVRAFVSLSLFCFVVTLYFIICNWVFWLSHKAEKK
jgi:hypothetical protein